VDGVFFMFIPNQILLFGIISSSVPPVAMSSIIPSVLSYSEDGYAHRLRPFQQYK